MADFEARHYEKRADGSVVCGLCPHRCHLRHDEVGVCRTRRNVAGRLIVLTYGQLVAHGRDPIEKKPLFHFRPGSLTLSVASMGCNLVCPFCQNHQLSTAPLEEAPVISPDRVVAAAADSRCESIAFTYAEPTLMLEYAADVAPLAAAAGIDLVFVTNGQATRDAATELSRMVQAANIDLKSFSRERYREVLGGKRDATLRAIEILARAGVWVEITTLVIPGFNDSDDELREMAAFIAGISRDIPWHLSRFHPSHRWQDREVTPRATLRRAGDIGVAAGLKFVYTGNVPGDAGEKTRCPGCGQIAIDRVGYRVAGVSTRGGRCKSCGDIIAGRGLL